MDREGEKQTRVEYEKPEIKDYGDLRELTAGNETGSVTDVPKNSPIGDIFTL